MVTFIEDGIDLFKVLCAMHAGLNLCSLKHDLGFLSIHSSLDS